MSLAVPDVDIEHMCYLVKRGKIMNLGLVIW